MTNAAFELNNLRGVLLPITTPFRSGGVDHDALRANLDRWTTTGIAGYVVLGSTGERVHLDEAEYLDVIETAREVVPRSMSFIVGAGQQSTVGTIKEITKAAAAGADAVLVSNCDARSSASRLRSIYREARSSRSQQPPARTP